MNKLKNIFAAINWKKEAKLLPGYIIVTAWVVFTFVLLVVVVVGIFLYSLLVLFPAKAAISSIANTSVTIVNAKITTVTIHIINSFVCTVFFLFIQK